MKDIETIFNKTMGNKNYYFAYDYDMDEWVTENPIDLFENELLANGYTFEVIDENYFDINGKVYSCNSEVVAFHESDTAKAFAEFEDEDGNAPEFQGEWEYEYYNFEQLYERTVQGDNLGFIYKDYEAYLQGDQVCYISEFATDKTLLTEKEAREVGFTRFQLEALCEPYNLDTDYLFELLDWQSPEVLIDELVSNMQNDELEEEA